MRIITYVVWLVISLSISLSGAKREYNKYVLLQVIPDTRKKYDALEQMVDSETDEEFDVWNFPSAPSEPAEILVPPHLREKFEKRLASKKIVFHVLNDDIQKTIDDERRSNSHGRGESLARAMKDGSMFNIGTYNNWENISTYLYGLADSFSSIVSVEPIGLSHENRELIVIKVGKQAKPGSFKPAIWIDGGIHAREWISPATIMHVMDTLIQSYEPKQNSSENTKKYVDNLDWYFLPVMNPDGYVHSFAKDRMWRKNRNPNNCTTGKKCCFGVDLNRNFGYQWGAASGSKCSNTYGGVEPFSEPETKAVRDFVSKNAPNIKAFLTYHSYAQSWRYPYSYKRNTFPEDVEELRTLGRTIAQTVHASHGFRYKVTTGGKSLSGVSRDWAKGEAKIKYVYCVELASRGSGFVAGQAAIVPSGEENWVAIKIVADKVIENHEKGDQTEHAASTTKPENIPNTTTDEDIHQESETVPGSNETASTTYVQPVVCDDIANNCTLQFEPRQCELSLVRAICGKFCNVC